MNERNEERKKYVERLMNEYEKNSKEYLELVESIYQSEDGFRQHMSEKFSPMSYEKALNKFFEETNKIDRIVAEKKSELDERLNAFSNENSNYSANILSKVRKNELTKEEVIQSMNELATDFDTKYNEMINNYKLQLKDKIALINKIVEKNRKFVVEYGNLQLTEKPTVNEYKPIYDKHDAIYDKFIYEFEAEALRINFLAEQIKSTYNRITKLVDENYDIFKDMEELLNK